MSLLVELRGIYGTGKFAVIDDEDYPKVKDYICYSDKRGYVYIKVGREKFLLHRFLLGIHGTKTPMLDHWDRNRLNNQKHNLRRCTNSQNQANTKSWMGRETKGIYWFRNKWIARIMVNGNRIFLGRFDNKDDALERYKEASRQYFGEFSYNG